MKALIITANPSSKGFSHQIAKQFAGTLATQGDEAEIINLYDEHWHQPFFAYENIKEVPEDAVRTLLQQKILEANHLVFAFPLWWGGVPAVLKNFFDQNFSAGFAFQYNEKGRPKGLLHGKTASVFCTFGAPKFLYFFSFFPFLTTLKSHTLAFCGIKTIHTVLFDQMHKRNEEDRKKMLEKVTQCALRIS